MGYKEKGQGRMSQGKKAGKNWGKVGNKWKKNCKDEREGKEGKEGLKDDMRQEGRVDR